jgi:hypothetical protein
MQIVTNVRYTANGFVCVTAHLLFCWEQNQIWLQNSDHVKQHLLPVIYGWQMRQWKNKTGSNTGRIISCSFAGVTSIIKEPLHFHVNQFCPGRMSSLQFHIFSFTQSHRGTRSRFT